MMRLARALAIISSLVVAVVSLVSGANLTSVFLRAAATLLALTFLSLVMYRITLPESPAAAEPLAPAANDGTRGTRIDLMAGDEH